MRDHRGIVALVAVGALVAGCQHEGLLQPGSGPTAQTAPPLLDRDITLQPGNSSPIAGSGATRASLIAGLSVPAASTRTQVPYTILKTAVVLMPKLPIPGASAVVARRPNLWPKSVIMLSEDSLTLGAFGSAMHALSLDAKRSGGEDVSTTQILQIHGQDLPPSWKGSNASQLPFYQWTLDTLKRVPRYTVQGVGAYRAILISVFVTLPARPNNPW